MSSLNLNFFSPTENTTYIKKKIGYFRILPHNEIEFFLTNFFRVDGMLFSIHFIFMFLCDNEKKHSVNLNHGKCKSQTNTLSAMSEKQTDK